MNRLIAIVLAASFAVAATACSDATSQVSQSTTAMPVQSSQVVQSEAQSEAPSESSADFSEQAQGGMIFLNEIYRETFGAEYDFEDEMLMQAAFESEQAYMNGEDPAALYLPTEEAPSGLFLDPSYALYIPVLNFRSMQELTANASEYITDAYMQTIQAGLEDNFFEYEGTLYLVRGARGYGSTSLDLDTVAVHEEKENAMQAELLTFGEYDGEVVAEFTMDNGRWKINTTTEILPH